MTKNSCSQPRYERRHLASEASPRALSRRSPWTLTASIERRRGVFSSMLLPKCVRNEHGIRSVVPAMNGGDVRSHTVKAAAECVTRRPPLGKEEPSVSPWNRRSVGSTGKKGLFALFDPKSMSIRVSIFRAPTAPPTAPLPPRHGKNQWAKSVQPCSRAHLNMPFAIAFWSSSEVGSPDTRSSWNFLKTFGGTYFFMVASSKMRCASLVITSPPLLGGLASASAFGAPLAIAKASARRGAPASPTLPDTPHRP
mmetsp:Transcript_5833/g.13347  ORF Transcript_5833/g.13347 Transcript_5833/m.13347 type:complete len:253 (+) Transcript_5833:169-927(+)